MERALWKQCMHSCQNTNIREVTSFMKSLIKNSKKHLRVLLNDEKLPGFNILDPKHINDKRMIIGELSGICLDCIFMLHLMGGND
jgi:hypothetical protein